jgi:opacity protein-like surface antigen
MNIKNIAFVAAFAVVLLPSVSASPVHAQTTSEEAVQMATDIFGEGSLAFGLLMTSTSPTYWYVGEGGPEFAATDGRLGLGLEIRRMFEDIAAFHLAGEYLTPSDDGLIPSGMRGTFGIDAFLVGNNNIKGSAGFTMAVARTDFDHYYTTEFEIGYGGGVFFRLFRNYALGLGYDYITSDDPYETKYTELSDDPVPDLYKPGRGQFRIRLLRF